MKAIKLVTITEYAKLHTISRRTVYDMMDAERLEIFLKNGDTFLNADQKPKLLRRPKVKAR